MPNLMSRRARTRKEGKCQLCETKADLKEQFTVTNDLENGVVVKKKNAARKGAETASHYCGECANKRVKQKEAWMQSAKGDGSKKATTKKAAKGKAKGAKKAGKAKAAKKANKAKPKAAKPKSVKKVAKKPKATEEEPF